MSEDGMTRISASGTRWGATLETAVATREKMWPTPRAGNPGSRKPGTGGKVLAEEARKSVKMWPTPTSRDHKDTGDCANVPTNALLGREVGPSKAEGSLNPAWVEALMGFPRGWTEVGNEESPE